jgi:hypothetical protein
LLREWLARAGLTLEIQQVFAAGDTVVLEQRGVWKSETGERELASAFRVEGRQVVWFGRFDSRDAALAAAGLYAADER